MDDDLRGLSCTSADQDLDYRQLCVGVKRNKHMPVQVLLTYNLHLWASIQTDPDVIVESAAQLTFESSASKLDMEYRRGIKLQCEINDCGSC